MAYATRVDPGKAVRLEDFDPGFHAGLSKAEGENRTAELLSELEDIQEELYATRTHGLLVVFQALDTGGKDGVIRKVMGAVSPQSCRVESFKVPTEEELAHDFLWRVHRVTPGRGQIVVFNRSHYEDVLVVRVKNLVPEHRWQERYAQINAFERLLAQNDTLILKFYLHISKEEQAERLRAREEDPRKAWKLNADDWRERRHWDRYVKAYEDALSRCSTAEAPWYVVPANKKWFRDLAVAEALVESLTPYRPAWRAKLAEMREQGLKELAALRAEGGGDL